MLIDDFQSTLQVPRAEEQTTETDQEVPRSASATSSLDPYYFSVHSPSESPVPPLPSTRNLPKTPEMRSANEPVTPGKDPAAIDRRGLVGVGELTTPRWARGERHHDIEIDERVDEADEGDLGEDIDVAPVEEDVERDLPDSPWTIEAIDGEQDERDEVRVVIGNRVVNEHLLINVCSSWKSSLSNVLCEPGVLWRTRVEARKFCILVILHWAA